MVTNQTITPDEARRASAGEMITFAKDPVMDRLEAELNAGVYSDNQRCAVKGLVMAWRDTNVVWMDYIGRRGEYSAKLGIEDPYDKVGDPAFWVKALAVTPAFRPHRYAKLMLGDGPTAVLGQVEGEKTAQRRAA